jgi:hypothetical protein
MVLLELGGLGPEIEALLKAFPKAGEFMTTKCSDDYAVNIEKALRWRFIEYLTIEDDTVIDDCVNVAWQIDQGNYGPNVVYTRAADSNGRNLGFHVDFPIKDVTRALDVLKPRVFSCDKEASLRTLAEYEDIFGDILNVRMRGSHWWTMGMTWTLIDLIGMENMMIGMVYEPEAIHAIMGFLCDEHIRFARYLEEEGLFTPNTGNDYVGSGTRGYVSSPSASGLLKDNWVLLESQETTVVSPEMFAEFILPYHKRIAELFGYVYYGCCEPLDRRMDYLEQIHNIRSYSVSPWCDQELMASYCIGRRVFSRKSAPSMLGQPSLGDDIIMEDIGHTLRCADGCALEIIMKDLHTTGGDIKRVKKWVDIVRSMAGTVIAS